MAQPPGGPHLASDTLAVSSPEEHEGRPAPAAHAHDRDAAEHQRITDSPPPGGHGEGRDPRLDDLVAHPPIEQRERAAPGTDARAERLSSLSLIQGEIEQGKGQSFNSKGKGPMSAQQLVFRDLIGKGQFGKDLIRNTFP